MNKDVINVYWSPDYVSTGQDWSLLYPKPESLLSSLVSRRTQEKTDASFFDSDSSYLGCPAISSKFKNTFVFSNSLKTHCYYNFENEQHVAQNLKETGLDFVVRHTPTISDGPLIEFSLKYIVFSDQPLNAAFTAPFFHPAGYTKYGSAIPGEFDIGQWFRPYIFEVQMWTKSGDFILDEEPIFYLSFPPELNIKLHRFNYTENLKKMAHGSINANGVFGKGQSLLSRYNRFRSVGLREKILTEIQQNLIDDTI